MASTGDRGVISAQLACHSPHMELLQSRLGLGAHTLAHPTGGYSRDTGMV